MITTRQLKAKRIGGSIRIPHQELAKIVREYWGAKVKATAHPAGGTPLRESFALG